MLLGDRSYGPVNAPMDAASGVAYAALQQALALKSHATSERAHRALAQPMRRTPADRPGWMRPMRAMEHVVKALPRTSTRDPVRQR